MGLFSGRGRHREAAHCRGLQAVSDARKPGAELSVCADLHSCFSILQPDMDILQVSGALE